MIRVLVADDSATVRELLVAMLQSDPQIEVVGQARNGEEAVELAARLVPDLVTMDIEMPVMDGFEATRVIMTHTPMPILIVSSSASREHVKRSLDAIEAGALMLLPKPGHVGASDFERRRDQLIAMVKAMAQVKVVRRWPDRRVESAVIHPLPVGQPARLVAIAASTGGPAAVHRILTGLPAAFPVPVLIVQHIANGFVGGLADWLNDSCALTVKIAVSGEPLESGTAYLAPDDRHLGVDVAGRIRLSDEPPIGGFRPSATWLFESVAHAYGSGVAAVILTGMGNDGVAGLRAVKAAGGTVLAQDAATSVVFGMPGEAVKAGVADAVVGIQGIGRRLQHLTAGGQNANAHTRR